MQLRPLMEADLAVAAPWFEDAETRRWLGGPGWPGESLALRGPSRQCYLALAEGRPVGLVDIESYPDGRASFAYVTAPAERGRGFGRQMIETVIAAPAHAAIKEFFVGVESGNVVSERLVRGAGFVQVSAEDADSFTYWARRRCGTPRHPWSLPD